MRPHRVGSVVGCCRAVDHRLKAAFHRLAPVHTPPPLPLPLFEAWCIFSTLRFQRPSALFVAALLAADMVPDGTVAPH